MTPSTIDDLPKTAASIPQITIYGPHECPNCEKAMKFLDRQNVAYSKVNIEEGDEDHRHVTEDLGHQAAPVIIVGLEHNTVHWGGHRMDMLMALVRLCTKGIKTNQEAATR